MEERTFDIKVLLLSLHEQKRGCAVDDDADGGSPGDNLTVNRVGVLELANGFHNDSTDRNEQ